MKLENVKFFQLVCALVSCGTIVSGSGQREFTLKPVKGITEIPTREEELPESSGQDYLPFISATLVTLLEKDRLSLCKNAFDKIKVAHPEMEIQLTDQNVEDFKNYLLVFGHRKRGASLKLKSAFRCPSEPATFIHIEDYYDHVDNMFLWVIFKEKDNLGPPKPIVAYELRFVKSITEAFLQDIKWNIPKRVENNVLDADEFSERERKQMCHKAIHMVPNLDIKLSENERCDKKSKYYLLTVEKAVDEEDSSVMDSSAVDENDEHGIVQAFECSTTPPVYIHINDDGEEGGRTFWVILEKNETTAVVEKRAYQLKVLFSIQEVSENRLEKLRAQKTRNIQESAVNFNGIEVEIRREMCENAIKVTLGTSVLFSRTAEIGPSKFYALRTLSNPSMDDVYLAAMHCPTENLSSVYIHMSTRESGENLLWVLVERSDDFDGLNTWAWE